MLKKNGRNRTKILRAMTNKDLIYAVFGGLITLAIVIIYCAVGSKIVFSDLFKPNMFISILLAFVLNSLVLLITGAVRRKTEDEDKLDVNYDRMVKNYSRCGSFITLDNTAALAQNVKIGKAFSDCKPTRKDSAEYTIPVFDAVYLANKATLIDDCEKMYDNPYCAENMKALGEIYKYSKIYNQTNIRLDSIDVGSKTVLHTSRTKYYYSLITNRCIDYKINGISYRERFEEGPFVRSLSESTLSNHLGYNGYVETSDGYFVFIYRHGKVSIGKRTLQNSVGASLKAKYCLDESRRLTLKGLENAITHEIADELHLSKLPAFDFGKMFADFSFRDNVLFFYRDLVEGGKPQLMFM